ncbi:MAG: alanine racemase [Verrucomicrobiota bacterium JB023]|nr:alanine racemase [Verrucomicrobiota bacterium JB023]
MTTQTQLPESPPRAWAEIDLTALEHNLAFIRRHSGQAVMAVLKANAYGHGLRHIAKHLDDQNLAFFGVANVREARMLAEEGIKTPIYLLSPTFPDEREEVVRRSWVPCLSSFEEINHFASIVRSSNVGLGSSGGSPNRQMLAHLTLDTGMGRGGFLPGQVNEALHLLTQTPEIKLGGVGSHLPSADEDPTFTLQQFRLFDDLVTGARDLLPADALFHLSNSAGLLDYQSSTTNLVRPGLALYGTSPLPEWQQELQPVMTLKSRIALVRKLPAGHGVSYGRSSILERDTTVATTGIGYGDGLPRSISGKGAYFLVNGEPAPLLGRVTMDQIMLDVTELPSCHPGDEVEIFGSSHPIGHLAGWADTIPWEILTRITPRVSRVYR